MLRNIHNDNLVTLLRLSHNLVVTMWMSKDKDFDKRQLNLIVARRILQNENNTAIQPADVQTIGMRLGVPKSLDHHISIKHTHIVCHAITCAITRMIWAQMVLIVTNKGLTSTFQGACTIHH